MTGIREKESMTSLEFPLYERARKAGLFEGKSAVIVAPTATGKSYIGREVIRSAILRRVSGTHTYLVPYRALASEMFDALEDHLHDLDGLRIRVASGDHTDPVRPQETDVLVATYETFAALSRRPDFRPGVLVADEFHLLSDVTRGAAVEALVARLLTRQSLAGICALSAVIENGKELAAWLEVPLLRGGPEDRAVPVEFDCQKVDDPKARATEEAAKAAQSGEQAIIFCNSRGGAERTARDLAESVSGAVRGADRSALQTTADAILHEDESLDHLAELVAEGVAFHHAGLPRAVRAALEAAFRDRHLKVIASTPTLAAGVNLPAGLVVVRDVHRTEFPRGRPRQVLLPSGEVLNMLGRAGRPHQVKSGRGVALVANELKIDRETVEQLVADIRKGQGAAVESQLPNSFEAMMRFVLAVVVEWGEARIEDIADVTRRTFWYDSAPVEIRFDRPLEEDLMEDIPSYRRVTADMSVEYAESIADGVEGIVRGSSGKNYVFRLTTAGPECDCPAASQWRRRDVCKHIAMAIHEILFARKFGEEVRSRCLYVCAHFFGPTLDIGTRLSCAVEVLHSWHLIERAGSGWRATPTGEVAIATGLDLLLVRQAEQRVGGVGEGATYRDVGLWVAEDYFSEEKKRARWLTALADWLDEVDVKDIALPEKYRGDFENGLDDLARVAVLYGGVAGALGRSDVAEAARQARGCLVYGVKPDILPLAALRFPQLGRARCRFLHDERGIGSLEGLAKATPAKLAGRTVPERIAAGWVERAKAILRERDRYRGQQRAEIEDSEVFDELVSKFKVDPAAFEMPAVA